ncbi:3-methylitaconate isomerase [Allopusillimonas soli]|uniref:3-methylitaconate isomerase n=1 Tax=Allopusillimonas soli TaxID=659016 RepID=A0A853FED3_9BURK|nr:PrpF domain-containing protein [Allopusillimonas soli]NYT36406.1 3-methylitaconate isomerase [Allopusillimonas soli]TEA74918.1 3-methylitaconate isomerase [Allopusillimonas soli]
MNARHSTPFVLMRGGTSKGIFFHEKDVPQDRSVLVPFLLDIFGSPDRRQINGMGGADKLTSKAAIIGAPIKSNTDVTYLFGQVGIIAPEVDFNLNCGNLTAAVGVFALEEGLVQGADSSALVRVHNLNTDRVIHVHVPMSGGVPVEAGDFSIGGVPGTGAPIGLDFSRAAGAITGELLPLGGVMTHLSVPGYGSIDVSVVDCANLVVFVAADTIGMVGTETPEQIDQNDDLKKKLNAIRAEVAARVGLSQYWHSRTAPSTPMCVVVQRPSTYQPFTGGDPIHATSIDLTCRQFSTGATSKAMAATVTACTGVACRISGSVANQYVGQHTSADSMLRLGHPSGIIEVESKLIPDESRILIDSAMIWRTARRIADGRVYTRVDGAR